LAIYQSSYLSPNNTSVTASSPITFTAKIQGTIATHYQLIIYNMANTIIFNSTKLSLSPNLYQNDIFSYILNSGLTNGIQYKWTLTIWSNALSATTRETPFYAYAIPTLTMTVPSTITSKKFLFPATYAQAQSIPINRWYMVFLDSLNNIILQTPYSYSGNISYQYDGFISGNQYKCYTVVENQMNLIIHSLTYTFTCSYSAPSLNFIPTATLLSELSAVKLNWSSPIQINGTITGTSSYIPNLFTSGNTGLKIANSSSYVEFDVGIPLNFTTLIDYIPDNSFIGGKMIEFMDDDGIPYEMGYDSDLGCFYYKNGLITINGNPKSLPSGVFLIAIKSIEVLIIVNNQIYEYLKP